VRCLKSNMRCRDSDPKSLRKHKRIPPPTFYDLHLQLMRANHPNRDGRIGCPALRLLSVHVSRPPFTSPSLKLFTASNTVYSQSSPTVLTGIAADFMRSSVDTRGKDRLRVSLIRLSDHLRYLSLRFQLLTSLHTHLLSSTLLHFYFAVSTIFVKLVSLHNYTLV
jgi:hypothetical protein